MAALLEVKEKLKSIYAKYDIYLNPLFKFVLAICVFSIINGNIGYMARLQSLPVVLAVSLACCILPMNAMILFAAVFILLHLYALSIAVAAVACVLFLLVLLLYFRFAPKDGFYALLTPVCLHLNLGAVMPLVVGLTGKAYSVISILCGSVLWFFL